MSKIFFSYRSADSAIAERIVERLIHNYGRDDVHVDLRPPAHLEQDLRAYVEEFLRPYAVMVVVIGPTWIRARGGTRRLDDPQDIVRIEVASALARGIPVIPILVRGAGMPSTDDLPGELQTLPKKDALPFGSDETFRGDMMRLHRRLALDIVQEERPQVPRGRDDTPPTQARKLQLQERANHQAGRPPFEGFRVETLGEVLWILGAQHGELASRYGERQFPPDLSGANLSFLNLSGAELFGAKLTNANLQGADLRGSNLGEAILSSANLTEAKLNDARLNRAVLTAARLQLADLAGCSLEGADLSQVDLTTTTLKGAILQSATLHEAKLTGQELPGALLNRADLSRADLTDVALPRAQLEDASLNHARLDRADLSGALLVGADLSGASLNKTDLSAADLAGATVTSVEKMRRVIIDASTRFDQVKWSGKPIKNPRRIRDRDQRLRAYREVAQTYRDIEEMLRDAGFLAEASSYRLREQRMRRGLLFDTRRYGAWLFSCALNVISGYGERIGRTLLTYILVVLGFATIYFVGANFLHLQAAHLTAGDALVESLVSFHGRGFVASAFQLGDQMAGVSVAEAVCGLFVEVIFIASFSRRFLGF